MPQNLTPDKDGIVHATCTIRMSKSTDGKEHTIPFTFPAKSKPKGWDDVDYAHYLKGAYIAQNGKIRSKSPFSPGAPALTDEQKAANKVASKARLVAKKAKAVIDAKTVGLVQRSGCTDEELSAILRAAGKLPVDEV